MTPDDAAGLITVIMMIIIYGFAYAHGRGDRTE